MAVHMLLGRGINAAMQGTKQTKTKHLVDMLLDITILWQKIKQNHFYLPRFFCRGITNFLE